MVRAKKDPAAPKRGLSAYFMYAKVHREEIKGSIGKNQKPGEVIKVTEVMKAIAKEWNECSDKSDYKDMAAKDKERYAKQLAQFNREGKFDVEE